MEMNRDFTYIPDEVYIEIFFFVPSKSLLNLMLSSKHFNSILSSQYFWREKCQSICDLDLYLGKDKKEKVEDYRSLWETIYPISNYIIRDVMQLERNPDFLEDGYQHILKYPSEYDPKLVGSGVSMSFGKYRRGCWYVEMSMRERSWACSVGFCDPSMKINVDSEYQPDYVGMYHGGAKNECNFCVYGKRAKLEWVSRGMEVGCEVGTYVNFESCRFIGYFKKKVPSSNRVVRKVFFFLDLNKYDPNEGRGVREIVKESSQKFVAKMLKKNEMPVLSGHIWFHKVDDVGVFNFPKLVDEEFRKSFELLTKEEKELFELFGGTVDFQKEYLE